MDAPVKRGRDRRRRWRGTPLTDCPLPTPSPTPRLDAEEQQPPTTKNSTSTEMPIRWLPEIVVSTPTASGPKKLVTLPDSANRPKNCVICSRGATRTISERLAACSGPATAPIIAPSTR